MAKWVFAHGDGSSTLRYVAGLEDFERGAVNDDTDCMRQGAITITIGFLSMLALPDYVRVVSILFLEYTS